MDRTIQEKQNHICIVSAITGLYDDVKPRIEIEGVDWIMFSDKKKTLDQAKYFGWQTKLLKSKKQYTYRTQAKFIKWRPEKFISKQYKKVLWVDGCVTVKTEYIIDLFLKDIPSGLKIIKHPWRDCIYEEVKACWDYPKYVNTQMRTQILNYEKEGMPKKFGLWACTLLGHDLTNKKSRDICRQIKAEDNVYQNNDQIAASYVFWRNNYKPDTLLDIDLHNNLYYHWGVHNRHD